MPNSLNVVSFDWLWSMYFVAAALIVAAGFVIVFRFFSIHREYKQLKASGAQIVTTVGGEKLRVPHTVIVEDSFGNHPVSIEQIMECCGKPGMTVCFPVEVAGVGSVFEMSVSKPWAISNTETDLPFDGGVGELLKNWIAVSRPTGPGLAIAGMHQNHIACCVYFPDTAGEKGAIVLCAPNG